MNPLALPLAAADALSAAQAREDAAYRRGVEDAARVAAEKWPRGAAHTHASENADVYRAYEDAGARCAAAIRQLATKEDSDATD